MKNLYAGEDFRREVNSKRIDLPFIYKLLVTASIILAANAQSADLRRSGSTEPGNAVSHSLSDECIGERSG